MSYVKILLVCFILLPSTFSLVCVPRGGGGFTHGGGGRPHGGAVAPSASPLRTASPIKPSHLKSLPVNNAYGYRTYVIKNHFSFPFPRPT